MKEGDLIKFRYKDKIRYGYLLSRKEIVNKIGGLER